MLKLLKKTAMTLAAVVSATIIVNAQVVTESFTKWHVYNQKSTGTCDAPSIISTSKVLDTTVTYASGKVSYKIAQGIILPKCTYKPPAAGSTTNCTNDQDSGFVELKTGTAYTGSFETGVFANIKTVSLHLSWTGSYRNALLYSSVDNGSSWQIVPASFANDTLVGGSCGQYGTSFSNIAINKNNVKLKISPTMSSHPTKAMNPVRINKITIDGTLATGIAEASLADIGASIAVSDNDITFSSSVNGHLTVSTITGAVIGQQMIKGNTATFTASAAGIYLVRFVSNNKVYSQKVMVK